MKSGSIFHISEDSSIKHFSPRPSPSKFDAIDGDVVFGISDKLLHNYLFPRNCPRIAYYAKPESSQRDKDKFLNTTAEFLIATEAKWVSTIQHTTLYCYEFDGASFSMLDECAGYYISCETVTPISVTRIDDIFSALVKRSNVELRIFPTLWNLADEIKRSTLNFSLIRMRNAEPGVRNCY